MMAKRIAKKQFEFSELTDGERIDAFRRALAAMPDGERAEIIALAEQLRGFAKSKNARVQLSLDGAIETLAMIGAHIQTGVRV